MESLVLGFGLRFKFMFCKRRVQEKYNKVQGFLLVESCFY